MKDYLKRGSGVMFLSLPVFVILMALTVIFIQRTLTAHHIFETQAAADSIADSTAFTMAQEYGTYSDAVKRARELRGVVNSNMNVTVGEMSVDRGKFEDDVISIRLTSNGNRAYHRSFSARAAADTKFEVLGMAIIRFGMRYLGLPYVWGGHTPAGFDCSGFVAYCYNHFGYDLPYHVANGPEEFNSSGSLNSRGVQVPSLSQAKPGDIICFMPSPSERTENGMCGHTGIYIGHGMMIHSGSPVSGSSCVNIKHVSGSIQSIRRIIGYEPRRR